MEEFSKDYSTIFKERTLSLSDYLTSDTKPERFLIVHADMSVLKLTLKSMRKLIDDFHEILSLKIDWNLEATRQIRKEVICNLTKLCMLFQSLNCFFYTQLINRLAGMSKRKITLCGTRKISTRSDSYFKCILGHYRGKYRRITRASDTSFINASFVCGGDA